MTDVPATIRERLLAKTTVQPSGCWLFTGAGRKYGQIRHEGRALYAHRVMYEATHGPIPDGQHIDHLCNMPRCVNPTHLEAVTQQENNRRRYERSTVCGNGHPYSDLVHFDDGRRCRTCDGDRKRRRNETKRQRRASRKAGAR